MGNFFQGYNLMFSNSLFSSYVDWFHNFNCSLLLGVLTFVVFLLFSLVLSDYYFKSKKIEYQFGELLCSVFPTLILMMQMIPSLSLLYYYGLMNLDSNLTVKVTGHQWYWSYEFSDIPGLEFDSYMKSLDSLDLGEPRLLEVDNRCVVPCDTNIRFCITSADVIHAWALPTFSIKLDAMSGILSTLCYSFPTVGVFYGQCSEICGANHSFMPISLEVTLLDSFKSWCFGVVD
uniref:Cytochrome c oxidase subunit 2 n=2 Tax=Heterorhabditis TaxID=37861 RepID=A0A308_HETBA|nr:cytochrome c oxidase subunit II [Heterorhabditis indica]YP_817455.1 cytochrome c oxidase subunit II [Heterorhabditis bacteriophora]ABJ80699.1 cytochrome c oxidase subunit II [Heterorhabditis bacteriophora]AZU95940.1 cytochrome c oxidase subunit II [Heterorhabditis bacteriophora]QAA11085.1 cytochrome c oxidase subunit II [Heterorhabditis indica]QAA11097.1 cytochrome c oxidase subunit II [Heterorhabditis bacteriophora]